MTSHPGSREARYAAILADYLAVVDEGALLRAYELGREMFEQDLGLLDAVVIHHSAVEALAREATATAESSTRAGAVLGEMLGAFEMALRGFREANTALRELSTRLEQEVAARTQELSASLDALRSADQERRRLLARVVTAQEQERRRIAEDLHDDSIQLMTAVGLRLGGMHRRTANQSDAEQLSALERDVTAAIQRLRTLLFQLRPPGLDRDGLAAALDLYLRTMDQHDDAGPLYTLRAHLTDEPPLTVRETLYRIAQEAVTNARKHAQAHAVTIELNTDRTGLRMRIVDDGAGFEVGATIQLPGHLGLTALRERAAMAGGWCQISSTPGTGTVVETWIPIPANHTDGASRADPIAHQF